MNLSLEGTSKSNYKQLGNFEVLFKDGEKAEHIYIVVEGKISCIKQNQGRIIPVQTAKEKAIIGLEALSSNDKYIYSAISRGKTKLIPIEISLLKNFFTESPQIMMDLVNTLMEKVAHTTELLAEHRIVDDALNDGNLLSDEDELSIKKILAD